MVTMVPELRGTGLTNSNLKFENSWTVVSSALGMVVEAVIAAGLEGA